MILEYHVRIIEGIEKAVMCSNQPMKGDVSKTFKILDSSIIRCIMCFLLWRFPRYTLVDTTNHSNYVRRDSVENPGS